MTSTETIVMTRLALCNQEVPGMGTALIRPPPTIQDNAALPLAYTMLGPMLQPVPAPYGPQGFGSSGVTVVNRQYLVRLLIIPITMDEVSVSTQASQGIELAETMIGAFRLYYLNHIRLNTDGLFTTAQSELGLAKDIQFSDSGPVSRPGPGGATYVAVDFTIAIAAREAYGLIS